MTNTTTLTECTTCGAEFAETAEAHLLEMEFRLYDQAWDLMPIDPVLRSYDRKMDELRRNLAEYQTHDDHHPGVWSAVLEILEQSPYRSGHAAGYRPADGFGLTTH